MQKGGEEEAHGWREDEARGITATETDETRRDETRSGDTTQDDQRQDEDRWKEMKPVKPEIGKTDYYLSKQLRFEREKKR